MTLPTATEITALYLYGTAVVLQDLADPTIPQHPVAPDLQIDRTDFMTSGPGRFGGPAQIDVVQKFFAGNLDFLFGSGVTQLSLTQIQALTGAAYSDRADVQQVLYRDGLDDFAAQNRPRILLSPQPQIRA